MMDGKGLDIISMNLALYGQMDPDMPVLNTETKRLLAQAMESVRPKMESAWHRIIVFSTAGDMEQGNLEELFCDPHREIEQR